ncbi:TPA: hypothetical protein NBO41_004174 [Klebsiella pneumoniae]|nr:hypothetical protein [Klebsiella pneumoniae]
MMEWRFDENRADFRPAAPGEIEADPDALYIVQRGDVLMVREDGHERPMPERLDVAGVTFEGNHSLSLRAEMRRDGQWARAQLQARDRAEIALPLELPIWVTKTPLGDPEGKA